MCGLLGVVNGESHWKDVSGLCKYVEQGATVGVLRGEDSTGMFQVHRNGAVKVHKLAMEGGMFATTKVAKDMFNNADTSRATILHHRAATRGAISHENAHPFEHSDSQRYLVGVHNGSLYNTPTKYDNIDFDVDSDYAFYRIFKDGAKAFGDFNGAYAMIWYENDGKLRIACNGERAFSFAFLHKKNAMLIASEAGMLWWLAKRNDLEIDDILSPENHKLLTFDLNGDLRAFTDMPVEKYSYTFTNTSGSSGGGSTSSLNFRGSPASSVTSQDTAHGDVTPLKEGMDVEFYPTVEGSTALQLVGDIMIDTVGQGMPTVMKAVLSPSSTQLMDNVRAGLIDHIFTTVRGVSKATDGTDLVLCSGVTLSVSNPKGMIQETEDFVEGPGGVPLLEEEFRDLTKNGCGICKGHVFLSDAREGLVGWNTTTKDPICPVCVESLQEACT